MKCLVDNNLPPALARALAALSANKLPGLEQVIALREKFSPDTSDVTWMQALGQEGNWFILSADQFRKHGDLERKALRQSGLIVFCLSKQWSARSTGKSAHTCFGGGRTSWTRPNACKAARRSASLGS